MPSAPTFVHLPTHHAHISVTHPTHVRQFLSHSPLSESPSLPLDCFTAPACDMSVVAHCIPPRSEIPTTNLPPNSPSRSTHLLLCTVTPLCITSATSKRLDALTSVYLPRTSHASVFSTSLVSSLPFSLVGLRYPPLPICRHTFANLDPGHACVKY